MATRCLNHWRDTRRDAPFEGVSTSAIEIRDKKVAHDGSDNGSVPFGRGDQVALDLGRSGRSEALHTPVPAKPYSSDAHVGLNANH